MTARKTPNYLALIIVQFGPALEPSLAAARAPVMSVHDGLKFRARSSGLYIGWAKQACTLEPLLKLLCLLNVHHRVT